MEIKEYVALRKEEMRKAIESKSKVPTLDIVQVGDEPSSNAYIRGKMKDAAEVGFKAVLTHYEHDVEESKVLNHLKEDNANPSIDGVLVQLPLPKTISEEKINNTISRDKDVDGFVPSSMFDCCTPKGIIDYLKHEGFPFRGANAVVIGRSQIVGKPMARLLLKNDCNVTVLHSKSKRADVDFYLAHADLVIVAIGKSGFIDSSYPINPNAYVIDVGINRGEDGHLHGDCVPNLNVKYQSPVPGGVGLLTRLALLDNLLEAMKQ